MTGLEALAAVVVGVMALVVGIDTTRKYVTVTPHRNTVAILSRVHKTFLMKQQLPQPNVIGHTTGNFIPSVGNVANQATQGGNVPAKR